MIFLLNKLEDFVTWILKSLGFRRTHLGRFDQVAQQGFRFALVGVINTGIDWGVYVLLTRAFDVQYQVALVIAFLLAVTNSFYLNQRFTFDPIGRKATVMYSQFMAVNIVGLSLNFAFVSALVEWWSWHDLVAKLVATFVVFLWSFFINRFWTFKSRKTQIDANGGVN